MGSISIHRIMKSNQLIQLEAKNKAFRNSRENQKSQPATGWENALDIISISRLRVAGCEQCILILNLYSMSTIKNNVKLIGHAGQEPIIVNLDNGKKVARISIATNETFKNSQGEKQTETNWHTLIAWGKTAELVEKYVSKGKEIAIDGKLTSRSYEGKEGEKCSMTEVLVKEILLLENSI